MAFNLTEKQKDTLRWMVEEVRAGRLEEEFTLMWFLGSEGARILEYQGTAQREPPVLTPGVLAALETAEMIVQDIRYRTKSQTRGTAGNRRIEYTQSENGRRITLTGKAFEAVESDFKDPDSTPVTPDEFSVTTAVGEPPIEIQESLQRFRDDYPNPSKVAFIMMQFGQTLAHDEITQAIRNGLDAYGIIGVRADDKRYHDHLFYNVLTYIHGCGLGMAVFERLQTDAPNPNVALEVGYLFAMRKPVCLLKDETLSTLQADLVGWLYDDFNPQDPVGSIPPVVSKWLSDKGFKRTNNRIRSELEPSEPQSAQDALERYFDRMEQWVTDEQNPLATLSPGHPRRKMATTRTREILGRLNAHQKRDVLMFLYEHGLIKRDGARVVGLKDADFSGADLTRLQLWETNLDGASLSGADLSHAQFSAGHGHSASVGAVLARGSNDVLTDSMIPDRPSSLSGTDLTGAVLRRARLGNCDLLSADFEGADLTEADLRGAHLQLARNLTQEQIESAFGSSGNQKYMPDTLLPDDLTAPDAWKQLLSQQIEHRGN